MCFQGVKIGSPAENFWWAMALKAEAEFIYEDFVLHTAPEKFYLEPLQAPNEVLVIDRVSKDISLESKCWATLYELAGIGLLSPVFSLSF